MRVRQHIPSFVDGVEPLRNYVYTVEELERLESVYRWTQQQMFYRFAIYRNYFDNLHLMIAEFDGGKHWFVVAYLNGDDSLKILAKYPEWEAK